jgi:chromosome segregation ATPase
MSKDLKNMLDGIESSEKETAILQQKISKLTAVVEKQKRIISEQEALIEEQKSKANEIYDIPEDVYELKALIGEQRAVLNEREVELERAKSELLQHQKELELYKQQMIPMEEKLSESYEIVGSLKAQLAEKNSEVIFKNEAIQALENKVQEITAFSGKYQEEGTKMRSDLIKSHKEEIERLKNEYEEEKHILKMEIDELKQGRGGEIDKVKDDFQSEIENLKEEHKKETQKMKDQEIELKRNHLHEINELKSQIGKIEDQLLENKLESTEKLAAAKVMVTRFEEMRGKHEGLIKKVEELTNKNIELHAQIKNFDESVEELKKFKEDNIAKLIQFERLKPLMEQEVIFKIFLIVNEVGSITIDDLRKSVGSPMVLVKRHINDLTKKDLIETDDLGKITVKKIKLNQ